ncbi:hypothetical protein ACYPKM_03925 [Pseudomonas aeruginosa]
MTSLNELHTADFINDVASKLGFADAVLQDFGYKSKKAFSDDFAVRSVASHYQGIPCYYIVHSAIEYVYIEGSKSHLILSGEEAEARQSLLSDLQDELDDILYENKPTTQEDVYKTLKAFHAAHRQELQDNRIPMSSFAQYRVPFPQAYIDFDKKYYGKTTEAGLQLD